MVTFTADKAMNMVTFTTDKAVAVVTSTADEAAAQSQRDSEHHPDGQFGLPPRNMPRPRQQAHHLRCRLPSPQLRQG